MQVLEELEGKGRTERGRMGVLKKLFLEKREIFWMLQLRTVFPCGSNDRAGEKPKKQDTHALVGKSFSPLSRNHPRVTRENCHQAYNIITPEHFMKLFCKKLDSD